MDDFEKECAVIHTRNMAVNDYQKTLCLLRHLKAGNVSLDQITLTSDGWQVITSPAAEPVTPDAAS